MNNLFDLSDLRPILPASAIVLIGATLLCLVAFRVSGHRSFVVLSAGWLTNLIYLGLEAIKPASESAFYASLPGTYSFLIAAFLLQSSPELRVTRYHWVHIVVWTFITVLPRLYGLRLPGIVSDELAASVGGIVFSFYSILYLAWAIFRLSPPEALDLVVSRPLSPRSATTNSRSDEQSVALLPQPSDQACRSASRAKSVMVTGFVGYGLLQISYLFLHSELITPRMALPFYLALGTKLVIVLGIALLLFSGYRYVDELSRRLEFLSTLGALTASLEHDIRAPLSVVREALSNAIDRSHGDKPAKEELETAQRRLEIAAAAVEIIPSFRETAEYYKSRSSKRNLVDIVRVAWREAKDRPNAREARIVFDGNYTVIHVRVFEPRVIQAFTNIFTNALEAFMDMSVGRSPQVHIRFEIDAKSKKAVVRIRDNGPGMSAIVLEKATSPAFSTKAFGEANRGMGLFIARRIIEGHGGQLRFASVLGEFTEVSVVLPMEGSQRAGGKQ